MIMLNVFFLCFSTIQITRTVTFFDNFFNAFELMDSISSASAYPTILYNTRFDLWRNEKNQSNSIPDFIFKEMIDLNKNELK